LYHSHPISIGHPLNQRFGGRDIDDLCSIYDADPPAVLRRLELDDGNGWHQVHSCLVAIEN
jgi:hypothetical protein